MCIKKSGLFLDKTKYLVHLLSDIIYLYTKINYVTSLIRPFYDDNILRTGDTILSLLRG